MVFDRRARLRIRPADNPFASHRIDALGFRPAGPKPEDLAERLDALGGRADVVGPEGSGKTTLLEELSRRLDGEVALVPLSGTSRRPWSTVTARLPHPVDGRHSVLVDCAGLLGAAGRLMLRRRCRNARRLVITSHRPGRLPTLVDCQTSPELLADLVCELTPEHADRLDPVLEALFLRHDGNLRLCFRELYDTFAGRRRDRG